MVDERKTKASDSTHDRRVHWLNGKDALCRAAGTVTITWSPAHVTCEDCTRIMADCHADAGPEV